MEVLLNKNGNYYIQLAKSGDYSLLMKARCKYTEQPEHAYVVAYRVHNYADGTIEWERGEYYSDICDYSVSIRFAKVDYAAALSRVAMEHATLFCNNYNLKNGGKTK